MHVAKVHLSTLVLAVVRVPGLAFYTACEKGDIRILISVNPSFASNGSVTAFV